MGQFTLEKFLPRMSDGKGGDIFNANFRHIRNVQEQQRVVIDAAYAHNLPGLAHEYLQDTGLWWALLMYNGLQDPINDVVPGITIRIPNRNQLLLLLEAQSESSSVVRL